MIGKHRKNVKSGNFRGEKIKDNFWSQTQNYFCTKNK
jgi:hypothetical protein